MFLGEIFQIQTQTINDYDPTRANENWPNLTRVQIF